MTTARLDVKDLCVHSVHLMGDGTFAEFQRVFHSDGYNRESVAEPAAAREHGAAGFYASALWLRAAFADLSWEIHDVVAEDDLVVLHSTMSGRHVGTFVAYDTEGRPTQAFPPTGKTFAITQTHWMRVLDGKIIEHWANRDDQGMAIQLGWIPPSPVYLFQMSRALRKAREVIDHMRCAVAFGDGDRGLEARPKR
jgi:predicted ester cyclase